MTTKELESVNGLKCMPLGGSSLLSVPDAPFVFPGITGFRA